MAHNLNITNGKASMAYTGETPWHKLGTKVEGAMTSAEALEKAGLDYEVEKQAVYSQRKDGAFQPVPEKFATVRTDTEATLGIVGNRYTVLQNRQAFSFFDAIVGEKLAMYHTAGALGAGERVWMLAKLPNDILVAKDDVVEKYLLLTNSHDGSKAVEVCVTPIRVVCQNTLNMAVSSAQAMYRSRHTLSIGGNIKDIREQLGLLVNHFKLFEDLSKKLVSTYTTKEMVRNLFNDLGLSDERCAESVRSENVRADIMGYYEKGKGNQLTEVRGTAWALLNGVAEYADYAKTVRGTNDAERSDNRVNSVLFGAGADMKQKAMESILASVR